MVLPPAFAKKASKRLTEEQYQNQGQDQSFQFMRHISSTNTVLGPWNNFGQSEEVSSSNIDKLFLSNDEILDDNHFVGHSSRFHGSTEEAPSRTTIFNEIGDSIVGSVKLESESRLDSLDDDGKWIGSNRGHLKKRHLDEFKSRVSKRAAEKQVVCNILSEWQSLSVEEQRRRQKQAERNMKQILNDVNVVETEEIPPEYLFGQLTLRDGTPNRLLSDSSQQLFVPDDDEFDSPLQVEDPPERPRKRIITYKQASKSRLRDPNYVSDSVSPASTPLHHPPSSGYGTPDSGFTTPGMFHFSNHSRARHQPRKPRQRPPPPPIPSHHQWHDLGNVSHFSVTNTKPNITPLLDLEDDVVAIDDDTNDQLLVKMNALSLASSTEPRVVIVQLQPGLTFSSAKLLERCKGARLQEIQFFPDEGEAALFFLDPLDAQAFVKHMECARDASDHEFRRLQLASSWIRGLRLDSIYPAQKNVLNLVLSAQASRCIKVDQIPDIPKDVLEAHFKALFPNLVGLRLVRPSKAYEQQRGDLACALLDFSSINHAAAAREAFGNREVRNFEESTTEYMQDPCSQRYDKAAWCSCANCTSDEADKDLATNYGTLHGRHADHLRIVGEQYDTMADAQRPKTFIRKEDSSSAPMERM